LNGTTWSEVAQLAGFGPISCPAKTSLARQAQQAKPHGGTLSKHLGMTSTLIFGVGQGQASIFCDLKLLDYIWIILDAFGWLNRLSVNPFSTLSPLELTVATNFSKTLW
jgi:hypothetical protein